MSNAATGIAWHHSAASTQTMKLILIKIADMDGDGGAWPAMETLANAAMVTKDAARKAVRQLEQLGEIKTHLNEGGGLRTQKHMRTNVYEFLLKCPWYCDGSAAHRDLREDKNADYRPNRWAEIVAMNTDETPQPQELPPAPGTGGPQPQELPPAPGTGGPQPQELPNHHLTQQPIETSSLNDEFQHASAQEAAGADGVKESYATWRPGRKVAETAAQARAARRPAKAAPRTQDEQALVDHFQGIECPKGAGLKHWIPPGLTGCVRGCGLDLTRQPELENSA